MRARPPSGPRDTPPDYTKAQAKYDELWPLVQLVAMARSREEFLLLEGQLWERLLELGRERGMLPSE